MRWRIPLAVLLAVFVAASCQDTPVEPPEQSVAEAPTFNFMNGPALPGSSNVERWEGTAWFSVTDRDEGLRIRLFNALSTPFCGFSPDFPGWGIQDTWTVPEALVTLRSVAQSGEIPLLVYPWPNPNPNTHPEEFCEFLQSEVLATGTGTAIVNDNNVFWWQGVGGTNSYGVRVRGTVQDGDGTWYNVIGKNHYTIRGLCCPPFVDPADVWIEEMSTIEWIKYAAIRNGQN